MSIETHGLSLTPEQFEISFEIFRHALTLNKVNPVLIGEACGLYRTLQGLLVHPEDKNQGKPEQVEEEKVPSSSK